MLRRRALMTSGNLEEGRVLDRDLQPQNTSSEGAGDVFGETPLMLKSGDIDARDFRATADLNVGVYSSGYLPAPLTLLCDANNNLLNSFVGVFAGF
ncbi:hypothetical protein F511_06272 [Dorcoceras hygrometricum]|uniref:Uncharacterized protein n=1 Tax=Dorcoceras hygrometricum TaxID=472368 RepID=A0A2Z7B4E8_9LAMI|nr:hypothetical protein F511_06272 [Dorcoceras hygrometricum]